MDIDTQYKCTNVAQVLIKALNEFGCHENVQLEKVGSVIAVSSQIAKSKSYTENSRKFEEMKQK
jgi:hypothetical protein